METKTTKPTDDEIVIDIEARVLKELNKIAGQYSWEIIHQDEHRSSVVLLRNTEGLLQTKDVKWDTWEYKKTK